MLPFFVRNLTAVFLVVAPLVPSPADELQARNTWMQKHFDDQVPSEPVCIRLDDERSGNIRGSCNAKHSERKIDDRSQLVRAYSLHAGGNTISR